VLAAAEVVEIAEGVTDFRQSNDSKKNNNSNSHSNNIAKANNWKGGLNKSPPSSSTTGTHHNGVNNHHSFSKPGENRSQSDHPSLPKIVQVLLLSPRPKSSNHGRESVPLSEKERAELAAENNCFNCKEVGHMSRNCPNRNSVQGNSKKPPGMTNFNIEMVIKGEDSDELMEIRDKITV
jgi:Zinc knuckle